MNVEEKWNQIEELLASKKINKAASVALHTLVAEIVETSEGRDRIKAKIAATRFKGRGNFVQAVSESYRRADGTQGSMSVLNRQKEVLGLLDHLHPGSEEAYWELLSFLQNTNLIGIGQRIEASLRNCISPREELVRGLQDLPWNGLDIKERLALLGAARDATSNSDYRQQLERAFSILQARETTRAPNLVQPEVVLPTDRRPWVSEQDAQFPLPGTLTLLEKGRSLVEEWDRSFRDWICALADELSSIPSLDRSGNIGREILGLKEEIKQAHEETRQAQDKVQDLQNRYDLALQKEIETDGSLKELGKQRDEAQQEVLRLREDLNRVRQQVEETRRSGESLVRQAQMEKGAAVTTFKAALWDDLRRCLVEVLGGEPDETVLSEEQAMVLRRLRRIRDILQEHGIPQ
jgi:hypothetical protein